MGDKRGRSAVEDGDAARARSGEGECVRCRWVSSETRRIGVGVVGDAGMEAIRCVGVVGEGRAVVGVLGEVEPVRGRWLVLAAPRRAATDARFPRELDEADGGDPGLKEGLPGSGERAPSRRRAPSPGGESSETRGRS